MTKLQILMAGLKLYENMRAVGLTAPQARNIVATAMMQHLGEIEPRTDEAPEKDDDADL